MSNWFLKSSGNRVYIAGMLLILLGLDIKVFNVFGISYGILFTIGIVLMLWGVIKCITSENDES